MDDRLVGEMTLALKRQGINLLQAYRLLPSEIDHGRLLMELMAIPEGSLIADLGCGSGAMADICPEYDWINLNISMSQLKLSHADKAVCADMMELPFAKESLDGICLFYSLGHVALSTLVECARVLRRGGVALIWDIEGIGGELMHLSYHTRPAKVILTYAYECGFEGIACWPQCTHRIRVEGDEAFEKVTPIIYRLTKPIEGSPFFPGIHS